MHVLFGLGPHESGIVALEAVVERVEETRDDLTVAVFGDSEDRERVVTNVDEHLGESDVSAEILEIADDPGSRLVELAASGEFDRLALPGGERSPLGKITLDSVTEFVLMNATTTVVLIR